MSRIPKQYLAIFGALALPALAFDPATEIEVPGIPERLVSILDHGAKPGSDSLATSSIQQAIDEVRDAGGGQVVIPKGRYLSGPLTLGSHIDFHLAEGAVLVMSDREEDFPAERGYRPAFISAKRANDVRLSGKGIIEGQGGRWWTEFLRLKARGEDKKAPRRPQLVSFQDCVRVEVQGVTTRNPPNTHYSFKRCTDLVIRGIRATAPDESPNTDALNISSAWDVLVEDCFISTGDDNVVLLCGSKRDKDSPGIENVVIRNCEFGFGHGLSIGSYTSGGVSSVRVENVNFDGTTSGIRLKAGRDRGGLVEKLSFKNVAMKRVRYPIFFSSYYPKPPAHPSQDLPQKGEARIPVWRDILIDGLTVSDSRNSIILWGLPDALIRDVTIKNAQISAQAGALVFHAKDIDLSGLGIQTESGLDLQTFDAEITGLTGALIGDQRVKFK